jgi:16S rRNA (cytosine1402-N4)-methyltransferase
MHCANPSFTHIPVLRGPVISQLAPVAGGLYLDGTLGFAGHARALLEAAGEGAQLCGLDRDTEALEHAKRNLALFADRVHLFHLRYSQFEQALDELGWKQIDGALIDIGVSSMQLDHDERGFSFHGEARLDMRMDQYSSEPSAWHIVNRERYEYLKDIIMRLGEDPMAGRIARAICDARDKSPINTTAELADIVYKAYPVAWRKKSRNHPATRTFQALRMAVNNELGELELFLAAILRRLNVGGRLAVITFHSLEDRMVKHAMRHWAEGCRCPRHVLRCECGHKPEVHILTKKPIIADEAELARNPRASSAKLRVIEKCVEAGNEPR